MEEASADLVSLPSCDELASTGPGETNQPAYTPFRHGAVILASPLSGHPCGWLLPSALQGQCPMLCVGGA
ncbi:hypothetical protein GOP47_0015883 [Adiantum capillus-veneris]|uniref:Uncharacterized protein n=1 Tax=Adiantum capillus-veneris TaxID=13818 RepID=A0A9D4ULA9_ADICA|nr:hypothetical protein GOP47_0015883 [Adiantum capillus-veneris]